MGENNLRELLSKYHVFLIIAILILGAGIFINLMAPSYSDELIKYDDFTVRIPNDAEYNNISGGFEITGPHDEYKLMVESSNDLSLLYSKVKSSGDVLSEWKLNSTHYYIKFDVFGGLEEDNYIYGFYGFIIPIKDFDIDNHELTNENAKIICISSIYESIFDYTVKNIKEGGDNES